MSIIFQIFDILKYCEIVVYSSSTQKLLVCICLYAFFRHRILKIFFWFAIVLKSLSSAYITDTCEIRMKSCSPILDVCAPALLIFCC